MPRGRWVMNKETKIGLLVGLAFIIVIGVLLSDHIQSATEPQRAQLTNAPLTANRAVVAPGLQNPGVVTVVAPAKIEPVEVVPTPGYLEEGSTQRAVVQIGPGEPLNRDAQQAAAQGSPVQFEEVAVTGRGNTSMPVPMAADQGALVTPNPGHSNIQGGEMTLPVDGRSSVPVPSNSGIRSHIAAEGDSLWRLTEKYYGKYSKTGAELIIKANPTMGPKGEKIVVGKAYVIPPFPGTTANPVPPPTAPSQSGGVAQATRNTTSPTVPPVQPTKAQPTFRTYTVKEGDSLWKIANKQLSGGATIADLKALNKDLLKGSDLVKPGMTLKIPTGQVASAE